MKIIIRPYVDPRRELDLTRQLVSAIAGELWQLYGGNEQLNWLEAERHLERIIKEAWTAGQNSALVHVDSGEVVSAKACSVHSTRRDQDRPKKNAKDGRRNVRVRRAALIGAAATLGSA